MDELDRASQLECREREAGIARVSAQASMPVNTSGICRDCGEHIDSQRLAIVPHAHRCLSCQQDEDRYQAVLHGQLRR